MTALLVKITIRRSEWRITPIRWLTLENKPFFKRHTQTKSWSIGDALKNRKRYVSSRFNTNLCCEVSIFHITNFNISDSKSFYFLMCFPLSAANLVPQLAAFCPSLTPSVPAPPLVHLLPPVMVNLMKSLQNTESTCYISWYIRICKVPKLTSKIFKTKCVNISNIKFKMGLNKFMNIMMHHLKDFFNTNPYGVNDSHFFQVRYPALLALLLEPRVRFPAMVQKIELHKLRGWAKKLTSLVF